MYLKQFYGKLVLISIFSALSIPIFEILWRSSVSNNHIWDLLYFIQSFCNLCILMFIPCLVEKKKFNFTYTLFLTLTNTVIFITVLFPFNIGHLTDLILPSIYSSFLIYSILSLSSNSKNMIIVKSICIQFIDLILPIILTPISFPNSLFLGYSLIFLINNLILLRAKTKQPKQ